jgi:hypothetical protein
MPTNINDATYFELRLIEEICLTRGIKFQFSQDLSRYISLIKQSHGSEAQSKIDIQEARLKIGLPVFADHINGVESSLGKKLIGIDWVGRQDLGERVADLDLYFDGNITLPISVKSGGPGTERNLGGDSLRTYLGYDSTQIIDEMKRQTLQALNSIYPTINFGTSWEKIRSVVKNHPNEVKMKKLASKVGKSFQPKISDEIFSAWKSASDSQKLSVVKYLSLQNDNRDLGLRIFVAEDSHAYFKGVLDISTLKATNISLMRHQSSLNGTLEMSINGNRYWRLNINFTNGLGLSPIAVRVFLI